VDIIFLDTNALLKLCILELGSKWIRQFVKNKQIVISELSLFEAATAIRRRYVDGLLTEAQALRLIANIERDSAKYEVLAMGGPTQLDRLNTLIFTFATTIRIRALDGLQLVASEIAQADAQSLMPPAPFIFVSSDKHLLQAATALGFSTENPEAHP
jgi:hypothetical protein